MPEVWGLFRLRVLHHFSNIRRFAHEILLLRQADHAQNGQKIIAVLCNKIRRYEKAYLKGAYEESEARRPAQRRTRIDADNFSMDYEELIHRNNMAILAKP